jgi:hypothetical protein
LCANIPKGSVGNFQLLLSAALYSEGWKTVQSQPGTFIYLLFILIIKLFSEERSKLIFKLIIATTYEYKKVYCDKKNLNKNGRGQVYSYVKYNSFIPVLRSRSRKEPHHFDGAGAGAVTRCGSGSDNGIYHG